MSRRDPLSFQLYSLRHAPPIEQQLKLLQSLGYRNVELFGGLYDRLDPLAEALKATGLTARSGHFALTAVESEPQQTLEIAGRLGMDIVIVPYIQPQDRPNDREGWEAYGHRLAKAGEAVIRAGLRFAYHNHDFEFQPLPDGSLPIEHLLIDGVLWEADLAWIVNGAADPKSWLARFAGRVPCIHVKDIAAVGENTAEDGWADVGHGTLDWRDLWQAARAAGAEIMIAEHDNPSDGERFARRSIASMLSYEQGSR